MSNAGGGVLHLTNGDAAGPALRAHGVEAPILPWRDDAFDRAQAGEEARFMGDLTFFLLLDRIAPLIGRDPHLGITALGKRVLAGTADFVTARWIGGVEIVPPAPRGARTPSSAGS